jgi:hypothetical protein
MKQSDISELPSLSFYRYENFFNVYTDPLNGEMFYNVLRSINIFPSNNQDVEEIHYISPQDTWYNISYNFYKTPDLWWLICTYNQIFDATVMPETGTVIKLLKPQFVGYVLQELNKQINR